MSKNMIIVCVLLISLTYGQETTTVNRLQERVNTLARSLQTIESKYQNEIETKNMWNRKADQLEEENNFLQKENQELVDNNIQMMTQVGFLKNEVETLKQEVQALETENTQLARALSQVNIKKRQIELDYQNAKEKLQKLLNSDKQRSKTLAAAFGAKEVKPSKVQEKAKPKVGPSHDAGLRFLQRSVSRQPLDNIPPPIPKLTVTSLPSSSSSGGIPIFLSRPSNYNPGVTSILPKSRHGNSLLHLMVAFISGCIIVMVVSPLIRLDFISFYTRECCELKPTYKNIESKPKRRNSKSSERSSQSSETEFLESLKRLASITENSLVKEIEQGSGSSPINARAMDFLSQFADDTDQERSGSSNISNSGSQSTESKEPTVSDGETDDEVENDSFYSSPKSEAHQRVEALTPSLSDDEEEQNNNDNNDAEEQVEVTEHNEQPDEDEDANDGNNDDNNELTHVDVEIDGNVVTMTLEDYMEMDTPDAPDAPEGPEEPEEEQNKPSDDENKGDSDKNDEPVDGDEGRGSGYRPNTKQYQNNNENLTAHRDGPRNSLSSENSSSTASASGSRNSSISNRSGSDSPSDNSDVLVMPVAPVNKDRPVCRTVVVPISHVQSFTNEEFGVKFDFPKIGCDWKMTDELCSESVSAQKYLPVDLLLATRLGLNITIKPNHQNIKAHEYSEIFIKKLRKVKGNSIHFLGQSPCLIAGHTGVIVRNILKESISEYSCTAIVSTVKAITIWQITWVAATAELAMGQQFRMDSLVDEMLKSVQLAQAAPVMPTVVKPNTPSPSYTQHTQHYPNPPPSPHHYLGQNRNLAQTPHPMVPPFQMHVRSPRIEVDVNVGPNSETDKYPSPVVRPKPQEVMRPRPHPLLVTPPLPYDNSSYSSPSHHPRVVMSTENLQPISGKSDKTPPLSRTNQPHPTNEFNRRRGGHDQGLYQRPH